MAAGSKPLFALNHMTTPGLDCRSFIDLAAALGCTGVELRNDLADKKLSDAAFFDGGSPKSVGAYARDKGLRLLGLSEAYGFNAFDDAMRAKVQLLIDQAKESGAETISLIPRNDAPDLTNTERSSALRHALAEILPMLKAASMVAVIEPLGFTTSSLRSKSDAIEAIEAVGGKDSFKLVHDTFHHHLAGGGPLFPDYTGIVHISGVVDAALTPDEMQDGHRILVDGRDRLGNIDQIRSLLEQGYAGVFSYEVFSAQVHRLADPQSALRQSMDFIGGALAA
ncbi:MAG: TIM barrel protein [Rhizobiaceae bacterium]